MNIRSKIVALALIATMAINPIMAATPQKQAIAQAKSKFKTFKKDIKCMFSREGCSREQKKRLMWEGAAVIAAVLLISGGTYYGWYYRPRIKESIKQLEQEKKRLREKDSDDLDRALQKAVWGSPSSIARTDIANFKKETKNLFERLIQLKAEINLGKYAPEKDFELKTVRDNLQGKLKKLFVCHTNNFDEFMEKREGPRQTKQEKLEFEIEVEPTTELPKSLEQKKGVVKERTSTKPKKQLPKLTEKDKAALERLEKLQQTETPITRKERDIKFTETQLAKAFITAQKFGKELMDLGMSFQDYRRSAEGKRRPMTMDTYNKEKTYLGQKKEEAREKYLKMERELKKERADLQKLQQAETKK